MLTRKAFLKNSALTVGGVLGADLFTELQAQSPPGVLSLAELQRLHGDLYSFGDERLYQEMSQSFFKPGMELRQFIRHYIQELKRKYPLDVRSRRKTALNLSEFRQLCGLADGGLYLVSALTRLYDRRQMEIRAESLPNGQLSEPEHAKRLAELEELWRGLGRLERFLGPGKKPLILQRKGDGFNLYELKVRSGGEILNFRYKPVLFYPLAESLQQFRRRNYERYFEKYREQQTWISQTLAHERERWKGYRSRFSLSGTKASKTENILAQALNTNLLISLALQRIAYIARKAQSGVFTHMDRQGYQVEASGLLGAMDEIRKGAIHRGRAIYPEGRVNRLPLPGGRQLELAPLDLISLKLKNKDQSIMSVSTLEKALETEQYRIAPVLTKMEVQRAAIREALKK